MDDKLFVIACATIIVLTSMFALAPVDASSIVTNGLTGLFGVAVGRAMG